MASVTYREVTLTVNDGRSYRVLTPYTGRSGNIPSREMALL